MKKENLMIAGSFCKIKYEWTVKQQGDTAGTGGFETASAKIEFLAGPH